MISVAIIGTGNLGFHLYNAFSKVKSNLTVTQYNSRDLKDLSETDVTIIAVSDDAIPEVSSKIQNSFVVHTSGNTEMNQLKNSTRKGVFYPPQSFTKEKQIDFSQVPFCLETENEEDYQLLCHLANMLGSQFYKIDSQQRKYIHIAAVFANNFTNHLFQIAKDICDTQQIPFHILYPIIEETSKKIKSMDPKNAQTGPAIRNDQKTIKNHLNLLNSSQKDIYQKLTNSIQEHGKKL